MKYEFHAHYPFATQDDVQQAAAISFLAGKRSHPPERWPEIAGVNDDYARIELLSQAIVTPRKEEARTGLKQDPGGHKLWIDQFAGAFLETQIRFLDSGLMALDPAGANHLAVFPPGTWAVHIPFTLRKPYISRDDNDFYILDNPVKKEWVFKVPYVAPSQWKGALQAAMIHELTQDKGSLSDEAWLDRRLQLVRLFGNEKGVAINDKQFDVFLDKQRPELAKEYRERLKKITDSGFLSGNLHFYPTYFDRIGLEVINPHDRQSGAGTSPIYFECVPADAQAALTLLYVPLHGFDGDPDRSRLQCAADLVHVAKGLHAMLTRYGFGAKTSSGFGVVKEAIKGWIKVAGLTDRGQTSTEPEHGKTAPNVLEEFLAEYPDETFEVSGGMWMKQHPEAGREGKKRYLAAKEIFERGKTGSTESEQQPQPDFESFDGMIKKAEEIANALKQEGRS